MQNRVHSQNNTQYDEAVFKFCIVLVSEAIMTSRESHQAHTNVAETVKKRRPNKTKQDRYAGQYWKSREDPLWRKLRH